jgi:uncharacterized protein (DUF433 family)
MAEPGVSCDPDVMGGTPVFSGTRVPVQTLLDHLEAGKSIDDFLEGFPAVSREQAVGLLREAVACLVETVWSDKIRRRLDRLDSSQATTVPWEGARQRIRIAAGLDPHAEDS